MRVKFWGTRGSIPTPGPETVIYGGNTSCVEVRLDDGARLILDAGSGIRKLGLSAIKEPQIDATILLTHVHWDHIQGFPFFAPAYRDSTNLDIYGLEVAHRKIERLLSDQMEQVYFPVDLRSLRANLRFHDFDMDGFECRGAKVNLLRANHTTETVAFKITQNGRSVIYIPDNELARCGEPGTTPYADFVRFCGGVDLLIHDAQYTNATYSRFRGWGHSTFEEALKLGIDAGAKRVALFHHDPMTTDMDCERRATWCHDHIREKGLTIEVECAREEYEHDLDQAGASQEAPPALARK
jgi:phosphoribosyl 1,2-cyclic phosphodiesterase